MSAPTAHVVALFVVAAALLVLVHFRRRRGKAAFSRGPLVPWLASWLLRSAQAADAAASAVSAEFSASGERVRQALALGAAGPPDKFAGQQSASLPAPIVLVINPRSGGGGGAAILAYAAALNTSAQTVDPRSLRVAGVFSLSHDGLEGALSALEALHLEAEAVAAAGGIGAPPRLVCAGGDGSISAVVSFLRSRRRDPADGGFCPSRVPLGVLALGTGNDCSRALGFGGHPLARDAPSLALWLEAVARGAVFHVDVWDVAFAAHEGGHITSLRGGVEARVQERGGVRGSCLLYVGIGADAELVQLVELFRTSHALLNKLLYLMLGIGLGARALCGRAARRGLSLARISHVDDEGRSVVTSLPLTDDCPLQAAQTLLAVSSPSYAAGTNVWPLAVGEGAGGRSFGPQEQADGEVELMAISSLGALAGAVATRTGALGGLTRVAQGNSVRLEFLQRQQALAYPSRSSDESPPAASSSAYAALHGSQLRSAGEGGRLPGRGVMDGLRGRRPSDPGPTSSAPAVEGRSSVTYVQVDGEAYRVHDLAWLAITLEGRAPLVVGPAFVSMQRLPLLTRAWLGLRVRVLLGGARTNRALAAALLAVHRRLSPHGAAAAVPELLEEHV
jgi:diacylglycerol kinase (ATP)